MIKSPFSTHDLVVIPCNKPHIEHWFLLVVLPKKKIAAVLDSKTGNFVKPSARTVLDKIGTVLKELDCDVQDWRFTCSTKDEIPPAEQRLRLWCLHVCMSDA